MRPWLSLRTRSSGARASCARSTRRSAELERGRPVALELEGEPGIGKTRLLAELGRIADERGCLVLTGSASELEVELPFWVFVDALDEYVASAATLAPLGDELALVLPPPGRGAARDVAARRASPRAPRRARAARRCWPRASRSCSRSTTCTGPTPARSSCSARCCGGRPSGPVLIALAMRPRQVPERLLPALERAHRAGTLTRLELAALSRDEAHQLLGDAADAVYDDSGGNPFYLQQLARSLGRTGQLPRDVTAALAEELALLSDCARSVLQGAAVAGDPFAPELAAAAADVDEADALDALDELLRLDLVRPTGRAAPLPLPPPARAPRGLRRRARRLAARRPRARGAGAGGRRARAPPPARTTSSATRSSATWTPSAVLRDAGLAADQALPASAAHWFAAALRLLPAGADGERLGLLVAHARALAQSGDFAGSREALLEGLRSRRSTRRCGHG